MATPIDDELSQIGAALAKASDGEPVDLSPELRIALARARTEDVLAAIGPNLPLQQSPRSHSNVTDAVRESWADNCLVAFANDTTLQRIAKATESANHPTALSDIVLEDDCLTDSEKKAVLAKLADAVKDYSSGAQFASRSPMYLRSIRAEGFRGIGRSSEIKFEAAPGLTVIYGANGSGKSSFVEAVEIALYGNTARPSNQASAWTAAIRNAHRPDRLAIDITVVHKSERIQWPRPSLVDLRSPTDPGTWRVRIPEQCVDLFESGAVPEAFRPVLGPHSLAGLLDEDPNDYGETPLARMIRSRLAAMGADDWATILWQGRAGAGGRGQRTNEAIEAVLPFYDELGAWGDVHYIVATGKDVAAGYQNAAATRIRDAFADSNDDRQMLPPSEWNRKRLQELLDGSLYHDNDTSNKAASQMTGRVQRLARIYPASPVAEASKANATKVEIYFEMLTREIVNARLRTAVERTRSYWKMIRNNSSIDFGDLTLRYRRSDPRERSAVRAKFDLAIEGFGSVERGVLSQGEMHTLILCLFLPALLHFESPFGFAIVDDPVLAMDSHAIYGLAQALSDAAGELQLIVFTHDKRLIEALRNQDIDHTLINVTRGDRSWVECEPCYDPVTQRLFDARREAEQQRGRGRLSLTHIQDVTDHCRRAIEAACMRARRQVLLSEGKSGVEIKNVMDDALAGRDITTRGLLALAIFGDFGRHGDVRDHVAGNDNEWGEWVDETLRRVNGVMHAKTARNAREALGRDLHTLIDEVERLTQKIEENCSESDHRDA